MITSSELQPGARLDDVTALDAGRVGPLLARVDPAWSGFGGALGGYVAAIALRAMAGAVDPARQVRSLLVSLPAATRVGDVEVDVRVEREGSSVTIVSARMHQGDTLVALAHATFGRPGATPGHPHGPMPDVPGPLACAPIAGKPVPQAGSSVLVEHRPAGGALPLSGAEAAELSVWMRLVEGRPLDALSATLLADAAPPALYAALREAVPIPSLEIALHFPPALPGPRVEWALGTLRCRHAGAGYAVEDGELWSEDGALLVLSRQLRRILA